MRLSEIYALVFGLFLGLSILKFGNPIILNDKISPPRSIWEACFVFWPPLWGIWLLIPLALAGAWVGLRNRPRRPAPLWLWLLPLIWFGWQLISATKTVDAKLTTITIGYFATCLVCYYVGAFVLREARGLNWVLAGLLAAFAYCLVRAIDQSLFEFPRERQMLMEGQQTGWTNFPTNVFLELKKEGIIVSTNGVDVANPTIMAKYVRGRVNGTMVYPNALAGLVILLFPVALALGFQFGRQLRRSIHIIFLALIAFLGLGSLFWTGSKSGWLIATGMVAATLLSRLRWSSRAKTGVTLSLVLLCLVAFAARFHGYFASGATSVGARLDYWTAAVKVAREKPLLGSGPGTFQRPYALLKSPDAEMARLVHNDYLEQFSDSGIIGGLSYGCWIVSLLFMVWKRIQHSGSLLQFAVFMGLLGWFAQGMTEFGLYIPALAWSGFALAGCILPGGNESVRQSQAPTPTIQGP